MPGFRTWGRVLDELLSRQGTIWVHGRPGSGISTVVKELASRRESKFLDDADLIETQVLRSWIEANPFGVLGAHRPPSGEFISLELMLYSFQDDPPSISRCLQYLADEEMINGPLPSALGQLPCPGELRGLKNRVLRWKFMGQLPELVPGIQEDSLPLESDDLASNLHVLERLLLHRSLRRSYGNRVEAAQRLGISRRQLYLLIARHGDPVRGEAPTSDGPKRLGKAKMRQNSS